MKLTRCPICGEELQATLQEWVTSVIYDTETEQLVHYERDPVMDQELTGLGTVEERVVDIYCRNDHYLSEMLDADQKYREHAQAIFDEQHPPLPDLPAP